MVLENLENVETATTTTTPSPPPTAATTTTTTSAKSTTNWICDSLLRQMNELLCPKLISKVTINFPTK